MHLVPFSLPSQPGDFSSFDENLDLEHKVEIWLARVFKKIMAVAVPRMIARRYTSTTTATTEVHLDDDDNEF